MNEEYYRFSDEEEIVLRRGGVAKEKGNPFERERREILQELSDMHYYDDREDEAWECWNELQEYRKRYCVSTLNTLTFYDFCELFFN